MLVELTETRLEFGTDDFRDMISEENGPRAFMAYHVLLVYCSRLGVDRLSVADLAHHSGAAVNDLVEGIGTLIRYGYARSIGQQTLPNLDPELLGQKHVTAQDVAFLWNKRCTENNARAGSKHMPKVTKVTPARCKKISRRLSEDGWYRAFVQTIKMLPLKSKPGFTWSPDFDWTIENTTNVYRVLEGSYS